MLLPRCALLFALLLPLPGWAATADPLTRIADIRALPREEMAHVIPVHVRGVVTWRFDVNEFAIEDDSGGIWIQVFSARKRGVWAGDDADLERIREGMELDIEGVANAAGFAPAISPKTIRLLGTKPLPPARPLDRLRFFNGHESGQRIEARGVVLAFDQVPGGWRLRLQTGPDFILVMAASAVVQDPRAILGAEVRVRGVGGCGFNTRSEFLNARVMVSIPEDVVVEKEAPTAPFSGPSAQLDRLRVFQPNPEPPHRVRVTGTVSSVLGPAWFYLQDGAKVVRVEAKAAESTGTLVAGDRVEAVGFIDMSRNIGGLGGAEVRRIGHDTPPAPETIAPEQVMAINAVAVETGQAATPHDYDGHLIRFRATLVAVDITAKSRSRLTLEQGKMIFESTLPFGNEKPLAALLPGSEVEVTGIVQLEYGLVSESRSFLQPIQLSILLRDPADVVVLRTPPWWTPRRLLAVIAVGALTLGGALLWAWQLRQQVRRKTQELAAEMRARHDAALEFRATLRERNRLAATLHDTLLQTVSGIGFQLEACEASAGRPEGARGKHLEVARRMLDVAVNELRSSVWALRSLPLKGLEFSKVLESLVERARNLHAAEVEIRAPADLGHVPDFVAGNLLLAAQEALHNALKHGKPRHVVLEARRGEKPGWIVVEIRDDGVGFTPGAQVGAKEGHFGLAGIRERIERLDGLLRIESTPGQGTTVHLEVPVRAYDDDVA